MRSPEVQGMWGASWCITYTTYQCPLLLIIDYCYFKLYTTALHHYLSLIIATPSYALLHHITTYHWLLLPRAMYCYIMIITLTHRPTVLSGQQLPSAVALPLLQQWIICSIWLSRPPSPNNFGWWWSRESGGPTMQANGGRHIGGRLNGGRRSMPLPQTPTTTPTHMGTPCAPKMQGIAETQPQEQSPA